MIASSMIDNGLSWWQSWLCVWIGYLISGTFICMTGRIGATYHISFPVVTRASFGIWGSLWPVFNRAAMACIWYGVQTWIGGEIVVLCKLTRGTLTSISGECVTLMIRAIWTKYNDLPNSLPASSNTNTRDFLSFFLFWLCSLPAIWFPVHQIRHLFTVKAFFVPVAGVAYFIWAIVKAHGIGPIVHQGSTKSGGALGWAVVSGIMSSIANFATLIVNDPDFARFAKKPKDALWSQFITIPVGFAVTSFIGIIVSSSSAVIYHEAIWNPLELLSRFLDDANGAARFGVFIIAFAFALAQLGTNIAANSVSAGTDMTALLPRFLNIRRGGYICAGVGLAMCPWSVVSQLSFPSLLLWLCLQDTHSILIAPCFFQEPPYHLPKLHHIPLCILGVLILHRRRDHYRLLCCPPGLSSRARALLGPKVESVLFHGRCPLAWLSGLHLWHFDQHCRFRGRHWEASAQRSDVYL